MRIYVLVEVFDSIPYVRAYTDGKKAMQEAKHIAEEWPKENEIVAKQSKALPPEVGHEIYFSQKEDGNMKDAVSLQEVELPNIAEGKAP